MILLNALFSERKSESRKFNKDNSERKQTPAAHGGEKKNEKSRDCKEKGQSEEKEKTPSKVYTN